MTLNISPTPVPMPEILHSGWILNNKVVVYRSKRFGQRLADKYNVEL